MSVDLGKTLKKLEHPAQMPDFRTRSLHGNDDDASQLSAHSPTIGSDKVIVIIRVVFLKIGEIETVKECFSADAFVQAKWREPALDAFVNDKPTSQNVKDIKWDSYWNPKLSIANWLSEPKETIWNTVSVNSKGEAFICESRRIKGTFLENLELDEFPFDTQDISLTIMSEMPEDEVELQEDTYKLSDINTNSFVDEQEWRLYRNVITTRKTERKVYQESAVKLHSTLSFTCRASRRIGFFIWNIFFVMFLISSMTFTTFGVDHHKAIQNRIQLTLVVLLTTVTFKFTVNQSLPKISYLTYLDFYVLTSMVSVCLICMWHAILGSVLANSLDKKTCSMFDKCVLIAFISVFYGGHAALILFILFVVLRKRRRDRVNERQYVERLDMASEMSDAFQLNLEK